MEKGRCLLLFLILCEGLDGLLPLQRQEALLVAGGQPLQCLPVLKESLLPVLLGVVMVGLVLEADFFDHVEWPLDPFPNFVERC